jgi:para-aminobenzoate synthetase/4-amino-4-deoxychorismate lyase
VVDFALIRDPESRGWLHFHRPVEVVSTFTAGGVAEVLARIDEATTGRRGLFAVGFLTFEAAPAFDGAFRVHRPIDGMPLLQFGLFEEVIQGPEPRFRNLGSCAVGELSASLSEEEYHRSIGSVRDLIARGETYQVNHTFRLRGSFDGDPRVLFLDLVRSQPTSFAAYLDINDRVICSASPELFFQLDGDRIVSRPMKGTIDRGFDLRSDRERGSWLAQSPKNRAENAMITDMVRNDLGRVARVGSVAVTRTFDVERHPTVFQLTSTVEARTAVPVSEVIAALFPPASVTGAPKVRTMEIINELEADPRGVYTGAIGVVGPGRRARFSVAIRTAVVDRDAGRVEYGVGSGVVWDSEFEDEYRECAAKAKILSEPVPEFELLETMLWEPSGGFSLLDRHLDRLADAAEYFDREIDLTRIRSDLESRSERFGRKRHRVRLLVDARGSHRIEASRLEPESAAAPVRLGLAASAVKREEPFLHFKTTNRTVYDRARASRPECDDVLLWNEGGEATESTIANLVVKIDGKLVTPSVECGLLAGTFRAELLERGEIVERIIRVEDLGRAEALCLINSVQGWREVKWVEEGPVEKT